MWQLVFVTHNFLGWQFNKVSRWNNPRHQTHLYYYINKPDISWMGLLFLWNNLRQALIPNITFENLSTFSNFVWIYWSFCDYGSSVFGLMLLYMVFHPQTTQRWIYPHSQYIKKNVLQRKSLVTKVVPLNTNLEAYDYRVLELREERLHIEATEIVRK